MAAADGDKVIAKNKELCLGAIAAFKRDLLKMRTGRASASLVEGVMVDYYGQKTTLKHLAQISTPEARLIVLQVYDQGAVASVEKAIQSAGLGFNPSRDGNTVRISIPPLTEDSRKEIVKHLHRAAEEIRVSIRNHRRDSNEEIKKLEKDSVLTKDEAKRAMDKIQKQTDTAVGDVDTQLKAKEAECMEV